MPVLSGMQNLIPLCYFQLWIRIPLTMAQLFLVKELMSGFCDTNTFHHSLSSGLVENQTWLSETNLKYYLKYLKYYLK